VLPARLASDQNGAVLVEATVMMIIILVFVLGSIEFLFVFYQWNAATKAVQIGARLAAVSDPVALGLNNLSTAVEDSSLYPGDSMPFFEVTCNGATMSCKCVGNCVGVSGYSTEAMNTIIFGRGSSSCTDATSFYSAGMCDIFSRIRPENVTITYVQTGLGYVGRPGGPVPTVVVALQNLPFEFFFLRGLLGFKNIPIPALTTAITGEDLSTAAPL
jgi:hypothetical protein